MSNDQFYNQESFRKNGFVIVRNALSSEEVTETRQHLDEWFKKKHNNTQRFMLLPSVLEQDFIYKLYFKPKIVSALRGVLGPELYYINDFHIQCNAFGVEWPENARFPKRGSGWHRDADSESKQCYWREKGYKFVKCGIFLQDADNGFGGGIYLKPASHKYFEKNTPLHAIFRLRFRFLCFLFRLGIKNEFLAPMKAGDLCFFDSRLFHASSIPDRSNLSSIQSRTSYLWQMPNEHTKYVVYWDACNEQMVNDFMQNSLNRALLEYDNKSASVGNEPFFSSYVTYGYPDDYPDSFVKIATDMGVKIASLSREQIAQLGLSKRKK